MKFSRRPKKCIDVSLKCVFAFNGVVGFNGGNGVGLNGGMPSAENSTGGNGGGNGIDLVGVGY